VKGSAGRYIRFGAAWLLLCAGGIGCSPVAEEGGFDYPAARVGDVVEDYHGTKVADPYRWMENPDAEETVAWVEAQNELTLGYLEAVPVARKIKARLTELVDYPRYTLPQKEGDHYFFRKNTGLQNQSVLYKQAGLDGEPSVLLDPNLLSEDGTVAVSNEFFTKDGTLIAYGLSTSGSDWQEIKIRDVDSGRDYDEVIRWCRFSSIAWTHDNRGFYYNRFPEPGSVPEDERTRHNRVYWHRLDTPQSQDVLVYQRLDAIDLSFYPQVTDDGKYLLLHVYRGTDPRNGVYYRAVRSDGPFVRLSEQGEAAFEFIDNIGSLFYFNTDLDAPRHRIIAIDTKHPARAKWREILPEQDEVLSYATMVNDCFATVHMRDAHDELHVYGLDGELVDQIDLPTLGAVEGISGRKEDREMFVGFTSFLYPFTAFRYDFASHTLSPFRASEAKFDPSGFETKQVFATSRDGTRVPVFITHGKGLKLDGDNPTLLHAYGGFTVNMTPYFSTSRVVWMENGGVFALAVLRGGGEYGETWHQAGMLENKQNVFDDFIAASEWLIENRYTSSEKLAIQGASNGGLLVAACMLQRPELFGAVVSEVPVTDMLRYHRFTVGHYWVPEYGNAEENPEHFEFLHVYSPVHNVKVGVAYPPTLITTADTDDRVVAMHGKKFAAALQAADAGGRPILLRVETKAGHGAGKPTTKRIDEYTDIYTFLFSVFGMEF